MSVRARRTVRCEACRREPATSFSWFADRARWYAPRSGTWRFTGDCTSDTEQYYVLLHKRGYGWFDSAAERADWLRHLREKDWFDELDFFTMLGRFEAAPPLRPAKGRQAQRRRMNVKAPAGRLR